MNIKSFLAGGCGLALLLCASSVAAEEPLDLSGYQTVAVHPVVFGGTAEARYVTDAVHLASTVKVSPERARAVGATRPDLAAGGEEGFGFGGASTAADIDSLRLGYLIGMLPLLSADEALFAETVRALEAAGAVVAGYSSDVQQTVATIVRSAHAGQLDAEAYLAMFRHGSQAIAASSDAAVQRFHGYLLVGLWTGFSLLSAELGDMRAVLANTGKTLIMLLEEDASFGGSDRQLAGVLRNMVTQLERERVDRDALVNAGQAVVAIQADR